MFKLQRFLAIANLVAIVFAATIITTAYYHLETEQGIAVGEHGNVVFSKLLKNTLERLYTPLLDPDMAKEGDTARQVRIETLQAAISRQTAGTAILKLKLFNPQGEIVFSTDADEIGRLSRENHYLLALESGIYTKTKQVSSNSRFGPDVEEILETYVPIRSSPDAEPIGVFEIYSDITTFMRHMQHDILVLVSLQVGIMFALYGYLFFVGRRADQIIHAQEAERDKYLHEIERAKEQLELRVTERTAELVKSNRELQHEIQCREAADARGQKFAQAVEQAPTAVLMTNTKGEIEYVNPRFCEVTGYTKEEVIGKNPKVINSGQMQNAFFTELWQEITAGRDWKGELLNRKKSGELFWESQTIAPIKNEAGQITHFIAVKEDITQAKRSLEWLRIHERALEASSNAICILDAKDPRRPIIYVNPSFTAITGYARDEVCGEHLSFLYRDEETQEGFEPCDHALEHKTSLQLILNCRHKRGHLFWNELSLSPVLDDEGDVSHFVAIMEDITDRKQSEEQLLQLATHDTLTNLPNRSLLQDRIEQAVQHAHREGSMIAVLFVDLDHFKLINDNLGHSTGDQLLQQVAKRLSLAVRECDTVARQSGDEFVVLLSDLHEKSVVSTVVERIIDSFQRPFEVADHHLDVTCSIGVCLFPDHGKDVETLFRHADIAMYHAKEAGRNTFALYEKAMGLELSAKTRLKHDLKTALAEQQFLLHYQPQVNVETGRVTGAEALIRWNHPDIGLIPPFQFISIAEETDMILSIGEWVLNQACQDAKQWLDAGHKIRVAVNLSMRQLQRQNLVKLTRNALYASGLPPHYLELEITESMVMTNPEEVITLLNQLKALGVTLSIDDFGTGYSSLAYLKRLPIDRVKIDRTFVQNITQDQDDAAIASATISMSHNLRCKVVAEGVETREQLQFLRDRACDEMQGYYFSRPIPQPELMRQFESGDCIDIDTLQRLSHPSLSSCEL